MVGELGAVIEGDTTTHGAGHQAKEFREFFHNGLSRLTRLTTDTEQA